MADPLGSAPRREAQQNMIQPLQNRCLPECGQLFFPDPRTDGGVDSSAGEPPVCPGSRQEAGNYATPRAACLPILKHPAVSAVFNAH